MTLSSGGSPYEASQSGQGGGRRSTTGTSRRDHGGGGEAGLCDGLAVEDGRSIKVQIVDRGALSLLKTELVPGSHGVFTS